MNPLVGLFAPMLALLPVPADPVPLPDPAEAGQAWLVPDAEGPGEAADWPGMFDEAARAMREAPTARQVRIEQRLTIRISPGSVPRDLRDLRDPRDLFGDMRRKALSPPRFAERKMNQCVPVAAIAGVQPSGPSRLMLFMRDQKIVSVALEKSCNARDFYSGFLVERSGDGMICAGRDRLLSRSGMNCSLGKLRQLVAVVDDEDE